MNHTLTVSLTRQCPDRPPMDVVLGVGEYDPHDPGVTTALADLLDRIADEVRAIADEAEGVLS